MSAPTCKRCCDLLVEAADILTCVSAHLNQEYGPTVAGPVIDALVLRMLEAEHTRAPCGSGVVRIDRTDAAG